VVFDEMILQREVRSWGWIWKRSRDDQTREREAGKEES
jgi:hypothetical protein